MKVLDSKRLTYTLMGPQDAELLFELDQDPEVMRYINGGKVSSWEDIEKIYLPRLNSYTNPDTGWGMWKAEVKSSKEFIGWILVRPMGFFSDEPKFDDIELGWRFKRSAWGKGYATEAAMSVKQALIGHGGVTAISAIALPDNHASINIMIKLGMSLVKQTVYHDPLGDEFVSIYRLGNLTVLPPESGR